VNLLNLKGWGVTHVFLTYCDIINLIIKSVRVVAGIFGDKLEE